MKMMLVSTHERIVKELEVRHANTEGELRQKIVAEASRGRAVGRFEAQQDQVGISRQPHLTRMDGLRLLLKGRL